MLIHPARGQVGALELFEEVLRLDPESVVAEEYKVTVVAKIAEQLEARTVCGRAFGPWMLTCKRIGSGVMYMARCSPAILSAFGVLGAGVLLGGAAVMMIMKS